MVLGINIGTGTASHLSRRRSRLCMITIDRNSNSCSEGPICVERTVRSASSSAYATMGHAIRDEQGRIKCSQCRNVATSAPCVQNVRKSVYAGRKSFTLSATVTMEEEDPINDPDAWYITSASEHMTGRREWFSTFEEIPEGVWPVDELTGIGQWVRGKGNIEIEAKFDGKWEVSELTDVLYVPALKKNLYSNNQAFLNGLATVTYTASRCVLTLKNGKKLEGIKQGHRFKLPLRIFVKRSRVIFAQFVLPGAEVIDDSNDWYCSTNTSEHMTGQKEWFSTLKEIPEGRWCVEQIDGSTNWVRGQGDIIIRQKLDGKWEDGVLQNVLYVPDMTKNIFSAAYAMKHGDVVSTQYGNAGIVHTFRSGKKLTTRPQGGLEVMEIRSVPPIVVSVPTIFVQLR